MVAHFVLSVCFVEIFVRALVTKKEKGMGNKCAAPASQASTLDDAKILRIVSAALEGGGGGRRFLDASTMRDRKAFEVKWANEADDPAVARSKAINSVATDFVVDAFFQSEGVLFGFLQKVTHTFEVALGEFRARRDLGDDQLFFAYKGGNVMRVLGKEFLMEMPASATQTLTEFFGKYFRRGDADFAIYLDINLPPERFDALYHELGVLSYLLQDALRTEFASNLPEHFSFFRYDAEWRRRLLAPMVEKLNEAEREAKRGEEGGKVEKTKASFAQ